MQNLSVKIIQHKMSSEKLAMSVKIWHYIRQNSGIETYKKKYKPHDTVDPRTAG